MTIDFDKREGLIWFDGEFVDWQDARVHVLTHGLHYGGSVFEGIRAYNGKAYKLREHMERLHDSIALAGMKPIAFNTQALCDATEELMAKNNLSYTYIRPVAWRGSQQMGIGAPDCLTHVAIACWEWGKYFTGEKGIALRTSKWKKPSPETFPTASKCAALYVANTMAQHESAAAGYQDALMLDYRGYVAELSAANIFMVKEGKLSTPIADCFLNGITRQTIIAMAKDHGYDISETRIMPEEILTADEVFATGTAAEITPIIKIDDTDFDIGPVTQRFMRLYKEDTGQIEA